MSLVQHGAAGEYGSSNCSRLVQGRAGLPEPAEQIIPNPQVNKCRYSRILWS